MTPSVVLSVRITAQGRFGLWVGNAVGTDIKIQ
jgi:hypothetical protein